MTKYLDFYQQQFIELLSESTIKICYENFVNMGCFIK